MQPTLEEDESENIVLPVVNEIKRLKLLIKELEEKNRRLSSEKGVPFKLGDFKKNEGVTEEKYAALLNFVKNGRSFKIGIPNVSGMALAVFKVQRVLVSHNEEKIYMYISRECHSVDPTVCYSKVMMGIEITEGDQNGRYWIGTAARAITNINSMCQGTNSNISSNNNIFTDFQVFVM